MPKSSSKLLKLWVHSSQLLVPCLALLTLVTGSLLIAPYVFAGRIYPNTHLSDLKLSGLPIASLPVVLEAYEQTILNHTVQFQLEDETRSLSYSDLGLKLDLPAISAQLEKPGQHRPIFKLNQSIATQVVNEVFDGQLEVPVNASLTINSAGKLLASPAKSGQVINSAKLADDLARLPSRIKLEVIAGSADITDSEIVAAQQYAEDLLTNGLKLVGPDFNGQIKPWTLRRMLTFIPGPDPDNSNNQILIVSLDKAEASAYLTSTISPNLSRNTRDARFEISSRDPIELTRIVDAQTGQELNLDQTLINLKDSLANQLPQARLAITELQPRVTNDIDPNQLGIQKRLAQGHSDFSGSPANRVHNIRVGTSRYHGLLIAPDEEFSFNHYLGPVTASAGYKAELVIKNNQTIPEYGGGLCQVSTTAFRAALHTGLEISERRNHSYAVSYYGTPGFDSTIYPGHTDLRFINNTPGYILIQTRVVGSQLIFDFWGADDGREVQVSGPFPYNRQPDGAVKATLEQSVKRGEEVLIDRTFYSNYKSPDLYPKTDAPGSDLNV